mgnify:CR=1 FL=1
MPTRRTRRTRKTRAVVRRRRPTAGRKRGGSLWSWIKKKAIPWIRKKHLLSKAIGPVVGFATGNPLAGAAAGVAASHFGNKYGFGKRRGMKRVKYRRRRK